jgi:peptide-methionine (S)-S-oxide reductase
MRRISSIPVLALIAAFALASALRVAGTPGLAADPAAPAAAPPAPAHTETAVLAGGCFWGMEDVFESLRGVTNVVAGFSGGSAATAHYDIVSTGETGHAESVQITFDPSRISYDTLLRVYFTVAHDPTELNRQGPDDGTQYRSVIFFADEQQRNEALAYIAKLKADGTFHSPIVTQVVPLRAFYPAESYHQHYAKLHPDDPYIVENDAPKVAALRQLFPALVKPNT